MNDAKALCDRLEAYDFRCEAGPLRNCVDWQRLKELVGAANEKGPPAEASEPDRTGAVEPS